MHQLAILLLADSGRFKAGQILPLADCAHNSATGELYPKDHTTWLSRWLKTDEWRYVLLDLRLRTGHTYHVPPCHLRWPSVKVVGFAPHDSGLIVHVEDPRECATNSRLTGWVKRSRKPLDILRLCDTMVAR